MTTAAVAERTPHGSTTALTVSCVPYVLDSGFEVSTVTPVNGGSTFPSRRATLEFCLGGAVE